MRALVTGGAGFIGSSVVEVLFESGADVVVVDNLVNGRRENIEHVLGDRCKLIVSDIRDTSTMTRLFDSVDVVFHLACLGVRHSLHSPQENHDVNATATLQLLSVARSTRLQRFVYVSSSEVYGLAGSNGAPSHSLAEDDPKHPATVYGASKLAGECYTQAFHTTYGLPTVVVRAFNTYGPRSHHEGDSGEVIPKFILRALAGKPLVVFGDGRQSRDFSYVTDTARGIVLAGTSDSTVGTSVNLGTGIETEIGVLAEQIATAFGRGECKIVYEAPRPGDVYRLCADISRARSKLGFAPRVSLGEGIANLKSWYECMSQSPEALLEDEIVRNWELQPEALARSVGD